jgi:hypothetical protein
MTGKRPIEWTNRHIVAGANVPQRLPPSAVTACG